MSDLELLHDYARTQSQPSFTALVNRHLNLVYSAALRQVRSPQLAEEISQSVFLELSHHAADFPKAQPLAAWLYVVTRRTAIDVIRRESRRLARETAAAELAAMKTPSETWSKVEARLDEAMETLNATERTAIVLRFFENQSLRDVGAALGLSEDTAQKRVTRALDRLRTLLARRGLTVTAATLATDLSAHSLQIAPAGMRATIATATFHHSATFGAAKVFAMTTAQKSLAGLGVALAVGAAVFEAQTLSAQRVELAAAAQATSALAAQLARASETGNITTLQLDEAERLLTAQRTTPPTPTKAESAAESEMRAWLQRVSRLRQLAAHSPEKTLPEIRLLPDEEWLKISQNPNLPDDVALRGLSSFGKARLTLAFSAAARDYVKAHNGQLPAQVSDLKPYLPPTDGQVLASDTYDAIFARYAMRYTGPLADVPAEERSSVIVEITAPDEENDQRMMSGPTGARLGNFKDLAGDTKAAIWTFARANPGATPASAADLLLYFKPPLSPARQARFLQNPGPLLPR